MYRKSTLLNGVRIVSETIPYVKSVTLGIWLATGSRNEREHNHGVSHFIEHLMFKGTEQRSAKDIAEQVDEVGGQLNAFTGKEYTCYYMKVLDTHLDFAMDILSDMLTKSKFDSDDILREREVVMEEVKMYEDSPDELVHDLHLEFSWSGHQLGRNILGTTDSIAKFDRTLVMEYFRDFYTPDNLVISAAGNLDHDRLVSLAEKYFGHLRGNRSIVSQSPPVLTPVKKFIVRDTEQVHLCMGTPSVSQDSPDIYAIHLLNNVLGGGISSRLFQTIREERGLAYSVYSYQTNYSDAGLLTIYAGTRPSNAAQVIELILQNLTEIKQNGITTKELAKAKEQTKGSLLLGLESSSSRMSRIGKMEITLGKFVSLEEVVNKIEQVSLEHIKQLAQELFREEHFCFTALGPADEKIVPIEINFEEGKDETAN